MASKHGSKPKKRKSAGNAKPVQAALPIVVRMSEEQEQRLVDIPHKSLEAYRAGNVEKQDVANIHWRLVVGFFLATSILELKNDDASIVMPINEAIVANRSIMLAGHEREPQAWRASPGEIYAIEEGIDIIDQLQPQVTRRDLVMALRKAQQFMNKAFQGNNKVIDLPKEHIQL